MKVPAIPSAFGLKSVAIAAGIAFAAGSGLGGYAVHRWEQADILQLKLDAAQLQILSLKADAETTADLLARANKNAADIAAASAANDAIAKGIDHDLASLPAGSICRFSADDVRRLRGIK